MNAFISYILLGLSLAAPIGPVNAAQLDKGIRNGFFHAWLVGIGAILADAIYMMVVYFGVVQFLEAPFVKAFLWLFGCFVLVYTGLEGIGSSTKLGSLEPNRRKEPIYKSFAAGFMMSISNPLTILFWLGIYGSVLAQTASTYETNELALYSAAIFTGLLIWDVSMAALSSSFRKFLSFSGLVLLSKVSGLALIGFGLYFGYKGVQIVFGL